MNAFLLAAVTALAFSSECLPYDVYQKRGEGPVPLLLFLTSDEPTCVHPPITVTLLFPSRQDGCQVLPAVCCPRWGVAPGPFGFRYVISPIQQAINVSAAASPGHQEGHMPHQPPEKAGARMHF